MSRQTDYDQLVSALEDLSNHLNEVHKQLKIYDSAFRFFKANNPKQASLLDDAVTMATHIPEVQNAASPEYASLIQTSFELAARVFQASSNPPKP